MKPKCVTKKSDMLVSGIVILVAISVVGYISNLLGITSLVASSVESIETPTY